MTYNIFQMTVFPKLGITPQLVNSVTYSNKADFIKFFKENYGIGFSHKLSTAISNPSWYKIPPYRVSDSSDGNNVYSHEFLSGFVENRDFSSYIVPA